MKIKVLYLSIKLLQIPKCYTHMALPHSTYYTSYGSIILSLYQYSCTHSPSNPTQTHFHVPGIWFLQMNGLPVIV